jgi:hypothetical protein
MKMYIGSSRKRPEQSHLFVQSQQKQNPRDLAAPDPVPALYSIGVTDWLKVNYPLIRLHQQSTSGLRSKIYHCTWHLANFCATSPYYCMYIYILTCSLWHVQAELFISGEEFLRFWKNGSQICFKASKVKRQKFVTLYEKERCVLSA